MCHILFICTANQCRSPMAAGLFKQQIARLGQAEQWQVTSADAGTIGGRRVIDLSS
jgi:protein-tyrosine-phosphatase